MKDQNPFRDKLYNHTQAVPAELWDKIEAHLPSDKKRFPFFWFATNIGLLMAGVVIFWLSLPNYSNAPDNPKQELEQPAQSDDTYSSNSNNNSPAIDAGYLGVSHEASHPTNTSTTQNETGNSTASLKSTIVEASDINGSGASSKKPNVQLTTILYPDLKTGKPNKSKPENIKTTIVAEPFQSEGDTPDENESPSNPASTEIVERRSTQITSHLPTGYIDVIELSEKNELSAPAISRIKPDPSCYKFSGEHGVSPITFDLFGGTGFAPRSFEINNPESNLFSEARKATERNQYAWSLGARVNYNLNHGLVLRAGLMYEQIGDIFDYRDTSAFVRKTVVDSFFGANGVFLYADTNFILIFGTSIKKIHNRYHHIDVPLLISYELPLGRSRLMLNAGPVINLTTSFRGQIIDILDANFIPRHITPGAKDEIKVYKNNVGLAFYLGAGLVLPMNEKVSALIEPRFLYRIKPVTLDSYPLAEHRHYAGLNLGIRYQFD